MPKDKTTSRKKIGTFGLIVMILISLAAVVLLKMTFVLLIVGMLPAIVVYIIDNSDSRSFFHTVAACNLAGVLPYVGKLWVGGNETADVGHMLSDMQSLFIMYLSAALGWGLMAVCPIAAKLLIQAINEKNVLRLKHKQKRLMEEWGEDVSQIITD